MKNIVLKKLKVIGATKSDAEIVFGENLTIISGASDTGKSYIFQTIYYLLGSDTPPKEGIEEANGYTHAFLELTLNSTPLVIERDLKGGKASLYYTTLSDVFNSNPASTKVSASARGNDNLSNRILGPLKMDGVNLLLNSNTGKKGIARLSDFKNILFLSEEQIVTDKSPFRTGQRGDILRENSLLKFILTGKDFADIDLQDFPKLKAGLETRIQQLNELIEEDSTKVSEYSQELIDNNIEASFFNNEISALENTLTTTRDEMESIIDEVNSQKSLLQKERSEHIALNELLSRFQLLKKQYKIDIQRLEHLIEANDIFSDLKPLFCPYCEQEILTGGHNNCGEYNSEVYNNALNVELSKTQSLLNDLAPTLNDIEQKILDKTSNINSINNKILEYNTLLLTVREQFKKLNDKILKARSFHRIIIDRDTLQLRINVFKDRVEKLNNDLQAKKDSNKSTKASDYTKVDESKILKIENTLSDFFTFLKFHEENETRFDKQTADISIGGKKKGSFGKGKRSIANAVATLGLISASKELQTLPRLLILDSPLTTYTGVKRKEGDKIVQPKDLQMRFFKLLIDKSSDIQIIVFDNEEPEENFTHDKLKTIKFTGTKDFGRYGFFPVD